MMSSTDPFMVPSQTLAKVNENERMPAIPEWKLLNRNGLGTLERTFKFKNLRSALAFANDVGDLAETEGKHPALLVEWGKVTVSWWIHKPNGIAVKDYLMASRTESLASKSQYE